MKDSKTFWDKSAEKYVKGPIKDEATYRAKVQITQTYFNESSRVIEFGCGSGGTAILHAPCVKHILAIDISSKMIEIAQRQTDQAGIKNITYQQGTLDDMGAHDGSFDVALGLNVLHLLNNVDHALVKIHRLLSKGGVFVSSTSLTKEVNIGFRLLIRFMQSIGWAPYVNHLSRNDLIAKLERAGFCIEHEWQTSPESIFVVARKA